MPIYEYECEEHGVFEEIKSVDSEPCCECPKCGKKSPRVISKNNFKLIGAGWAKDGYRSLDFNEKGGGKLMD